MSKMRSKGHQQNKFVRFITIPLRILGRARDFYVRSVTDCAANISYTQSTGCPAMLPKSLSVSSSRSNGSEDMRELIRAASARTLVERIDMDMMLKQQGTQPTSMAGSKGLPKCTSVGMGKIDEDGPCDFEEVGADMKANLLYPRSRSYAVPNRKVMF